jgi:NNP family nitrate/nitrite transporter-like MFS transporter
VQAGDFTTIAVVAGSFLRPLGGWLSDKWGGYRLLLLLFSLIAICLGAISTLPSATLVLTLFFLSMGMLGMGSGAVFQLAPLRFPREIGIATGVIGAAGGLGGFFLPSGLGVIRGLTGSYGTGLLIFAAIFAAGVICLCEFGMYWRRRWPQSAIERAGVFAYRGRQANPVAILPQPD